jgi:Family of unknown function (DUF6065)
MPSPLVGPILRTSKHLQDTHVKLIAHVPPGDHVDIRPAPVEREWMEETDQRYAYRCLPLNIANAFGWEILCPSGFTAVWDGGKGIPALQVHPDGGAPGASGQPFHAGHPDFPRPLPVPHRTGL